MAFCHNHYSCRNTALKAAEDICSQRGRRLTTIRRRIFEMIWESHQPVKAYDLLEKIRQDNRSMAAAPPTVYRALDFLIEEGLVHKIDSMNAYVGCMHPDKGHDCYFMICRKCGTAEECCSDDIAGSILSAAKQHHFTPQVTTLEILGICTQCQATGQ
jgi:Fur family zinc uptake transcriptional regulator